MQLILLYSLLLNGSGSASMQEGSPGPHIAAKRFLACSVNSTVTTPLPASLFLPCPSQMSCSLLLFHCSRTILTTGKAGLHSGHLAWHLSMCVCALQVDELIAGEVGYLAASIKAVADARVGDTITQKKNSAAEALAGSFLYPLPASLACYAFTCPIYSLCVTCSCRLLAEARGCAGTPAPLPTLRTSCSPSLAVL